MLCIWWDSEGVLYWELLNAGQTINATVYCDQLDRLANAILMKRPQRKTIRFLYDNARPHTVQLTREKLLSLQWEVLPHPPYSPDIAPSDYHLFRSLSNAMKGHQFDNEYDLKEWLDAFFTNQSADFFKKGIHDLPKRWKSVIDNGGNYFD